MTYLNDVIDVKRCLLDVGLVRERPDAPDHLTRPNCVVYYPFHGAARCVQVRSSAVEPAQTGLGVGDDGGERLVHFMGDRGCNFPERRDARYVCEIRLRLTKRFFGALSARTGRQSMRRLE